MSIPLHTYKTLTWTAPLNYSHDENDDIAFRKTIEKIYNSLNVKFECIRPTTPIEDVFDEFSDTKKNNFLNALKSLQDDCKKADEEKNFKKASEYLRNQFGDRFPLGKDEDEESKAKNLGKIISSSIIIPKPYAE